MVSGCAHDDTTAAPPRLTCPKAELAPGADPVVATIGGQSITLSEVDHSAARKLYDLRSQALDDLVSERVIEAEAKKVGKSPEEMLHGLVEARAPEVTEAEAKEFYEQNKERMKEQLGERKFEDIKPMLIRALTEQKRRELLGTVVEELKAKAGVKILLAAEKVEVAATGPSKGPSAAKITIVEFSDFQCPFCARGRAVVDQVLKAYDKDVRVVFRDFPLSFHPFAQKAAEAGHCADEQGKFWSMHDWMFDHQDALGVGDLKEAAKKLGLDGTKFASCLEGGKFAGAVAENQKAGEAAGVSGTPAFFINGTMLSGAQPFEKFKSEIDKQLGR